MDSSDLTVKVLEKQTPTSNYQVHEADLKLVPLWAIRRHVQLSRLRRKLLDSKIQKISGEGTHDDGSNH